MSGELPKGWKATTLGEICSKPQYGWTCKAAKQGQIKYLRTTDISGGKINWATVPFCEEVPDNVEKYRVRSDDILVSRAGSVGVSLRIADVPCDAVFASYLIRFKALNGILTKFVEYFLKSDTYWRSISEFSAGIAVPNVNASKLAALEIPLAPLAEQRRIVAKLEKLLGLVDACQHRLVKIPVLLKRFRQAVLAAACSGRLTEDWREERRKNREDWASTSFFDFFVLQRGYDLPLSKTSVGPYPIVTSAGIVAYHSKFKAEKPGVVTGRSGSIGKVFFIETDYWPHNTVLFVKDFKGNDPKFVYFFLSGFNTIQFSASSAVPTLNRNNLRNVVVEVPPVDEQQEIVHRVEGLFALADRIEERLLAAKQRLDQLLPSILAKSFRGELVPQDPNDEPAEILLKRIKSEKLKNESRKL